MSKINLLVKDQQLTPICVLLASYNGEKHIETQINSIMEQQKIIVNLLIRDDGSTDNTIGIVDKYRDNCNSNNISIVKNTSNEKGHCSNFSALCDLAVQGSENYFAFSDQDDEWLNDKLTKLQQRMFELETLYGKEMPILIHSDLIVVDEHLNEIAPSFFKYQGLPNPITHDFPTFCYQNVATGCTMFFNRALLEIATPIPKAAVVHDWWFAQCAKLFGVLEFYDESLIKYRQHGSNSIGALDNKEQTSFFKKHLYSALMKYPQHLAQSVEQSKALVERINGDKHQGITTDKSELILEFSELKNKSFLKRLNYAHKHFGKKALLERSFMYFSYVSVKYL